MKERELGENIDACIPSMPDSVDCKTAVGEDGGTVTVRWPIILTWILSICAGLANSHKKILHSKKNLVQAEHSF